MIVIPLQMWRFGFERDQYNLGTIVIYNDGTSHSKLRGNYVVKVYAEGADHRNPKVKPIRTGRVEDWPRESRPRLELVIAALHACDYKSRKKDEASASKSPARNDDVPSIPRGDEAPLRLSPVTASPPQSLNGVSLRQTRCDHGVSPLNRCLQCD